MGPRRLKFNKIFSKTDPSRTKTLSGADAPVSSEELAKADEIAKQIDLENYRGPEWDQFFRELEFNEALGLNKAERQASVKKALEESQIARDISGYKAFEEGAPTTQELKLRKLKELAEDKKEGVRDIDLSQLFDISKKVAGIAGLTAGGVAASSLVPKEAEAGVAGSVAARKKLLKKTEKIMDAWTSGQKGPTGGRELREQLQNQLDLDPTGTAKKEALRRLAAKTDVRQNPVTGEHEFKVYRGGASSDRFKTSPQSFTTNPEVAQEFADAYGGNVHEVWLPASKVGSVPSVMKEGQYLGSEGEIIAKPFKAESSLYTPKEETLHERISKRGKPQSESTDLYEGWPDDLVEEMKQNSSKKIAAGLGGTAIGAGMLAGSQSAQASEDLTRSQSDSSKQKALESAQKKYGASDKEIAQSLQTAGEWLVPFSKLYNLIDPVSTVSDEEEMQELERIKKEQFLEKIRNQPSFVKK